MAQYKCLLLIIITIIKVIIKYVYNFICGCRQCAGEHYAKKPDGHEYCIGGCDDNTMCGPVTIPQHHLQVNVYFYHTCL